MKAPDLSEELAAVNGPFPGWFTQALSVPREEGFVEVAGCPIHYLRWGPRDRPGIVMAHGVRAHARVFAFTAPLLAPKFNIVAFDLSGMGDSGARQSYSTGLRAQELVGVAEACGMFAAGKPFIVAHSFGGPVGIEAVAQAPGRFGGLVIVESNMAPPAVWVERLKSMGDMQAEAPEAETRPHRIYPDLRSAVERYRLAPAQACENQFLLEYVARHSAKKVEGGWSWKFAPNLTHADVFPFTEKDQARALAELSIRRAFVYGQKSLIVPPSYGTFPHIERVLGGRIPFVMIPGAHHQIMLDQPLAFVAALDALISAWIAEDWAAD